MPRNTDARHTVFTRMPPSSVAMLDELATARGISRMALVQQILEQGDLIREALRHRDLAERGRIDALIAATESADAQVAV